MLRAQGLIFWKTAIINTYVYMYGSGLGSSVGIATDYGLDGPGSNLTSLVVWWSESLDY